MDYQSIQDFNKAPGETAPTVVMDEKEKEIEKFVKSRVDNMQQFRKDLKIEEKWKEVDKEYEPTEIEFSKKKRFESDDELGLRSRLVPVKDDTTDWRSKNSDPTLLVKIQTALAIVLDTTPEAAFTVLNKRYENKTALAYGLWKRNWNISDAKDVYKLFVFNQAKYGWAPGKVFPRKIAYDKEILTEVNEDDPSKNVYEKRTNVWYNDVARKALDPFRTWIDEQTKPYDDYSTNDWYYEEDFSYDAAMVEFGKYPNFKKFIPYARNLKQSYTDDGSKSGEEDEKKDRQDIITIGFYENRLKDLYAVRVPKLDACLHYCPLPNDDGMLSLFHTPWVLRSATNPYGISLWEIIKQKKGLYDKMQNMTMDQLVLSIMKMFFYTGTNNLVGDGKIKIQPGVGRQIINGKIDFLDVPGPDENAWEGLSHLKKGMEDDSGITPTLQGETKGQTLGQDMISKEASLKRLKTPVDNIAGAIEQDAYITLSWMAQIYSTPEIKQFSTEEEIRDYEMESGTAANTTMATGMDEQGAPQGPFAATFYPQLNLQMDKSGEKLVESTSERFFQVNKDIPAGDLRWRGIIKVVPKSIITSSTEMEKQRKMEVFNIMAPLLPQPPEIYAKPVKQLLLINEEKPQDWLPDTWLQFLEQNKQTSLFLPPPALPGAVPGAPGAPGAPVPGNQTSMQGAAGTGPAAQGPTVVPQAQTSVPKAPGYSAAPRSELTRQAQ